MGEPLAAVFVTTGTGVVQVAAAAGEEAAAAGVAAAEVIDPVAVAESLGMVHAEPICPPAAGAEAEPAAGAEADAAGSVGAAGAG
ncbi:hypothetical protein [Streptacidiphilus rugosus]|uniref:hypothetical protein n=1 Tax=Streptacidiphilus rugosus TaxID=405783 RepID=UPI000A9479FD|nr:hypothetical protein [Streptacidiphilus rugosus]